MDEKRRCLKELQVIPGVGKEISLDLWDLGIREVSDLKNRDPEKLYLDLCELQGCKVDRCMLYVFRCAVYFATESNPSPHLLKWWNWKNI
jgi:hypothetical protein